MLIWKDFNADTNEMKWHLDESFMQISNDRIVLLTKYKEEY